MTMFRFTIRDVLWLMVVVGMGVAWWFQFQRANEESLRRKTWEKSARTLARGKLESFSVRLKDDGEIIFMPKDYDWNTGRMKDTGGRNPKTQAALSKDD